MDELSVCTPQFAESDALNNINSTPSSASGIDADKVINTKTDSTQVEGGKSDQELLKGLLTDDYCHVCEAVLLFESQRLSHYEGKKHSQKLKVYLQAKRAEKMKESTGPQRMLTADKDRFCELCNMVFSSPVVAKSHYEGKVHFKNLRKQTLQTADRHAEGNSLPSLNHDLANDDHKSASEDGGEPPLDPSATSTSTSADVDLKDPNKYCPLCAASFNNPQMALQHYNGRKHQRNAARQELLRELGDDGHQDSSLKCQICSVQFNSVEMYQAHMQGNKHHTREKKVIDLCKSQQKSYSTFADELADYIQVQKARGLTPKTVPAPSAADEPGEDEQGEEEGFGMAHFTLPSKPMASHSPASNLPHHHLGSYFPVEICRPIYQGAPWPPGGWDYNCPPMSLPASGAPPFKMGPLKRPRRRKLSSSSSSSTSSSSSSSYSSSYSSTSGSEDNEHRRRERRRTGRSRRGRGRRARDSDSDKQARRRKHRRMREGEEEEGRGDGHGETEKDTRRKRPKNHNKRRKQEQSPQDDFGEERGPICLQSTGDAASGRRETEAHIETEMSAEQLEERTDEAAKPKLRREKKKTTREKVDTRTEEEKLWDDSILGC